MKKALSIGIIVLLAIGASFVVYASNVSNSAHNMQNHITSATTGEICVFCHTPHGGDTLAPLWNHTTTVVAAYNVYSSATINGVSTGQPSGVSKACLSCHDGTVSVDSLVNSPVGYNAAAHGYSGNVGAGVAGFLDTGAAALATDLSDDHPISLTYVVCSGCDMDTLTGSVVDGTRTGINLQLFGSDPYTVECASCHNVHDDTNQPFLRASNTGSQLCLTCHLK